MQRREFITLLSGAALVWPCVARAQQADRVRRIGVLMRLRRKTIRKGRHASRRSFKKCNNWVGPTVAIYKLSIDGKRAIFAKLQWNWWHTPRTSSLLAPPQLWPPLQQVTGTVPIVFNQVADPVSAGFVASMAKPGGNVTGFTSIEYSIGAKWLELLKEIAPHVTRVGVIRDPAVTTSIGQFGAIQSVARSFGVELSALGGRDARELENNITEFARGSNCGLITVAVPLTVNNSSLIISLAAQHRLPTIYPFRFFVANGGLGSYGPDTIDPYRRAAGYVDRILKGEKPADMPVQAPVKYELVINLKTAKALGLNIPLSLQQRADEVIE